MLFSTELLPGAAEATIPHGWTVVELGADIAEALGGCRLGADRVGDVPR